MATIKDIAREAGLSYQTVGFILNGSWRGRRISEGSAQRVKEIAKQLNYVPNSSARSVRSGRTGLIGIFLGIAPTHEAPYYLLETIQGVESALGELGYLGVLSYLSDLDKHGGLGSRVFREQVLDGMIVLHSYIEEIERGICDAIRNIVWVDTFKRDKFDCINRDEYSAGRLAACKAIDSGAERLLWCAQRWGDWNDGSVEGWWNSERRRGLEDEAKEKAVDVEHLWLPPDLSRFHPGLPRLSPKAAVVCANVAVARRFAAVFMKDGKLPGVDYGLVSCDEMGVDTATTWPELSRVSFDRFEMGRQAGFILVKKIEGQGQVPSLLVSGHWRNGSTLTAGRTHAGENP